MGACRIAQVNSQSRFCTGHIGMMNINQGNICIEASSTRENHGMICSWLVDIIKSINQKLHWSTGHLPNYQSSPENRWYKPVEPLSHILLAVILAVNIWKFKQHLASSAVAKSLTQSFFPLFLLSCACWTALPVFILFHYSLPLFPNFLPLALQAPFAQSNQPAVNGWDYPAPSVSFLSFHRSLPRFFKNSVWRNERRQSRSLSPPWPVSSLSSHRNECD